MELRFFIAAVCAMVLCSCAEKTVDLLALEGTAVKDDPAQIVEQTDSYVRIKNVMNSRSNIAVYPAVTDFTPYKAVRWTVENKSTYPLSLWVRIVSKNNIGYRMYEFRNSSK